MTGLLLQFWPYIAGAVAAVFAGWKLRQAGINAERTRQALEKLAVAEDRLAMDREATAIQRRVSGLTDEEAKKEAMRWSRP